MSVAGEREPEAEPEKLTAEAIAGAFQGAVPPVPIGLRFRLGLVLVALLTVLLPALYLALVAGVALLVYLHLTRNTWIFSETHWLVGQLVGYGGPALVGIVLVFFMLKPLLARPAVQRTHVVVGRDEAPLLFAFVEHIGRAVRAPLPREVRLDSAVNASASFRRGVASLFFRRDLVLTIGTPLLAGLTLEQLGGVLAHELGHFAQGSGMRLTFLVRSVNMWLARVAHERDGWDQDLVRAAKSGTWYVSVVLNAALLAVFLTRKILAGLALVGHAVGSFMLREMELDADRYEANVVGSDVFASTAVQLRVLGAAYGRALGLLSTTWREGRLCDDLGGLVGGLALRMPPEVRAEIEANEAAPARAGTFDTHPPDSARLASARAMAAPGVLHLAGPARALLPAESRLPTLASLAYYRGAQSLDAQEHNLHPVASFLGTHDALVGEGEAAERVFGRTFDLFHPLGAPRPRVDPSAPAPSLEERLEALVEARETSIRLRAELEAAPPTPAATTSAPTAAAAAPPDAGRWAAARAATRERLATTLGLLDAPAVRRALPDADALALELDRLGAATMALAREGERLTALAVAHDELVDMFGALRGNPDNGGLQSEVMSRLARLHVASQQLEQRLSDTPYPFEHARAQLSIATFVAKGLPYADGVGLESLTRAAALLQRLQILHARCLGRLAVIAETLEAAATRPS